MGDERLYAVEINTLGDAILIRAKSRSQAVYRAFRQWQSDSGACAQYWKLPHFTRHARARLYAAASDE
jgi:hypothetical protein